MSIWRSLTGGNGKYHPVDKKIVRAFNKIRSVKQRKYLCHAPFKSMTFFHTGAVLACWYNKLYPLGHYPEDSIHDIWFSKRAEKLRDYIRHNDLSYGCADCRKNFSNMNFHAAGPWRYDFLPEKTGDFPVSIDFQISNKCNLQCIMCNGEYSANVRTHRENLDLYESPYDAHFFEQIEPFIPHLKEASFSGGEPFFAGEFFKVWDLMRRINPKINLSVTTNGNILNDKVKDYLNAMPFNISVSLDAITEPTYNKIRVNGNLKTVLSNMEFFSHYAKSKGTTFAVKFCPMRQNWHELPELATYLNDRDISFLYNTVFYPPNCSLWNLPSAKLKEIAIFLEKVTFNENSYTQKQNAIRFKELAHQVRIWQEESRNREDLNFEKMSVQQLADIFIQNVQNYLTEELNNLDDECPVQMDKIRSLIEQLIKDAPSEKIALAGMRFYASAPVERWLSEIEIRDYEKNRDRFLQAALEDE